MPYGITKKEIILIRNRDKTCVYCHKLFNLEHSQNSRKDWDTIEHLNHKQDWDSVRSYHEENKPVSEIVSICCFTCNSSRGSKSLNDWFKTVYCISKNINYKTFTDIVKNILISMKKLHKMSV